MVGFGVVQACYCCKVSKLLYRKPHIRFLLPPIDANRLHNYSFVSLSNNGVFFFILAHGES